MLMDNFKFISVVIPSYNRIDRLKICLASIEHMDYPAEYLEVIVVDDGSTDTSYGTLEDIRKQFTYNLRILRQPNGGPARARNSGIRNARGEFIAFTDDDCEVDKKWLKEIICEFKSEAIVGAGGMIISKNKDIFSQYIDYNRILLPRIENKTVMYLVTANACYRKKNLIDVNGFSEEIKNPGGEDPDLSFKLKKLGYELAFNQNSIVIHNHRQDLRSFYKTFYNYGRGSAFLVKKWGKLAGIYQTTRIPPVIYLLDVLYLSNRFMFSYKRGIGLRRSLIFAFLDHVRRVARISGLRTGY